MCLFGFCFLLKYNMIKVRIETLKKLYYEDLRMASLIIFLKIILHPN